MIVCDPETKQGPLGVEIVGVSVDVHRLLLVPIGATIAVVLWVFIHRTRMGLALRAIAQDEQAAMMLGIDADRAAALSMSLGSALAALAALLVLPLGAITVETGYNVLVFALAVSILGGLGSLGGTAAAGLLLGYAQIAVAKYLGPAYTVVVAFAFLLWRGTRAALLAPDRFGMLLGIGLITGLIVQALFNISVVISLLPAKGIPLPFISYGGSSIIFTLFAVGVLLNISQYAGFVSKETVTETNNFVPRRKKRQSRLR